MRQLLSILFICVVNSLPYSSLKENKVRKERAPKYYDETVTNGKNVFEYTFYYERSIKWKEAFEICKGEGADLIYIDTQRELIFVDEFIKRSGVVKTNESHMSIWTSGSDIFDHGNFLWMAHGKPITKNLFGTYMPDNIDGNEHCVELYNWPKEWKGQFYLNDVKCNTTRYYICKKDRTHLTNLTCL